LLIAAFGVSFYPLLTGVTTNVAVLPILAGVAGFFVGGVDLVFFDVVLDTCPKDGQAAFVGIYQTTVQVATFLAPLVGTALSDVVGLSAALAFATVLRFGGAVLLTVLGVGRESHVAQEVIEAVDGQVVVEAAEASDVVEAI
jgi:MFS family permease